ncbi:MAG: hypothetical protein KTR15_07185 [Phycisphaeraceae bacterium]|nr:hypothetical protein [Phycisphaeraceae bacterium]
MQRPTRIIVFGVFCLIVGVIWGLINTMEAGVSVLGPGVLEQGRDMMQQMGQELSPSQQQDIDLQIKVLSKPAYRVGQGIESVGSMAMALVLIIAGVGMLRDRAWSLKLAKWWAFYAIPSAAVTVVLSMRYVYPELPDAPVGGALLSSAFMLVLLWAVPVLLLRQLPTTHVKAYLAQRDQQRAGVSPMPAAANMGVAPVSANPPAPQAPSQDEPPAPPPTRPADNTWRDDPWNDPGQ